jgi:NAD(P)-dependent dehydrogenase (short-subunit alcohol dehydrogenase family)
VALRANVADAVDVGRLVTEAGEALGGRVDVLVNNVGPFSMAPSSASRPP